jgi:hypothetical protein
MQNAECKRRKDDAFLFPLVSAIRNPPQSAFSFVILLPFPFCLGLRMSHPRLHDYGMTYDDFVTLVTASASPVILLEGMRDLPPHHAPILTRFATHLAKNFPNARFRTGNAIGSDEAFARGVAMVDPARLEYVLPYSSHRSSYRPSQATSIALDDTSTARIEEVVNTTVRVSPQYQRFAVNYFKRQTPRQKAIAQLILRDTLKVSGNDKLATPVAGIFYVNPTDPNRGGTGHTVRVCRTAKIPVIIQSEWMQWHIV